MPSQRYCISPWSQPGYYLVNLVPSHSVAVVDDGRIDGGGSRTRWTELSLHRGSQGSVEESGKRSAG